MEKAHKLEMNSPGGRDPVLGRAGEHAGSEGKDHKCDCAEAYREIDRVIQAHKGEKDSLIEVLHYVQERLGYIPKDVQVRIAQTLGVSLTEVYGVVSFYNAFSEKPKGKHVISCCQGTACYVRGAPDVLARLEKELGIKAGDTTEDGLFSLEVVRCLGACGLAPVITVGAETHGRMTPDKVPVILEKVKRGGGEIEKVAGS